MKFHVNPVILAALLSLAFAAKLQAQTTAFTYQGRLIENGQPSSGTYDLRFAIYDSDTAGSVVAGPLTNSPTLVSNGLFTAQLDFGSNVFNGEPLWLQIETKATSNTTFVALSPRQLLTPTPYAIHALTMDTSGLHGTIPSTNLAPGSVENSALADGSVDSLKILDGTILPADLDAASFNGTFWRVDGNSGTTPGTHFLGTTDNQPLELKVNGSRGWRLEPTVNTAYRSNIVNVVGGSPVNVVGPGVYGAAIGGGGAGNWYGQAATNRVDSHFGTIGGGFANTIQPFSDDSTIGGGIYNTIQLDAGNSTIGGGGGNTIQTNAFDSTIGGGSGNTIQTNAFYSTIAGGFVNTIQTNAGGSTIGGGLTNSIQSNATYAVIGGGNGNRIDSNAGRATITGGDLNWIQPYSYEAAIGGGRENTIQSNAWQATISGGSENRVGNATENATVGGGFNNGIQDFAIYATIGGGVGNTIGSNTDSTVIGGGEFNMIQTNAEGAAISGGKSNRVSDSYANIGGGRLNEASSRGATVSGGEGNIASGFRATVGGGVNNAVSGDYSVVPGGANNEASGKYSFAGGLRAKANHDGCFVWADTVNADLASTGPNQFVIRATGGASIGSQAGQTARLSLGSSGSPAWEMAVPAATEPTLQFSHGGSTAMSVGYYGTVTATAFNPTSDRNAKENFAPVKPKDILNRLLSLPISRWNFKQQTQVTHVGPMAQDFHAAFDVGTDDRHIATVDADGVALAAIQGLNLKLKAKEAEIQNLQARVESLEHLVADLAKKGQ